MALGRCSLNSTFSIVRNETVEERFVSTSLGIFILSLVFLVGVPGNIFVIWSIVARVYKGSVTTLIILNLAIADSSLMAVTPFMIVYMVQRRWIFGNPMCKVVFYIRMVSMNASIQLITLMSLYRLVAVVWPQHVSKISGRRTVLPVLALVWVMVLLASFHDSVFREARCSSFSTIICDRFYSKESYVVRQYILELVFGFLIPYPIVLVSYICILRRIRQTKFWSRIKSEKLILAIVVTFCLCWLPYHIINMVQVTWALYPPGPMKKMLDDIWVGSRAVSYSFAFVSSCVNPVLYFIAGKSYIRRDRLEFMARVFEGAGVNSSTDEGHGKGQESNKEPQAVALKGKDRNPHLHSGNNVIHPASI